MSKETEPHIQALKCPNCKAPLYVPSQDDLGGRFIKKCDYCRGIILMDWKNTENGPEPLAEASAEEEWYRNFEAGLMGKKDG